MARDLPRTVLFEVSETYTGTVDVFSPAKRGQHTPRCACNFWIIRTITNTRYYPPCNKLTGTKGTCLDDAPNNHGDTSQGDGSFAAESVAPDCSYQTSSQTSNVKKSNNCSKKS